jgi:uncharacterized protein (DUF433 family)
MQQSLVGVGLYPLRDAARLVGEQARTVRRWLRGYSWKYRDGRSSSGPLWPTQFQSSEKAGEPEELDDLLGFRDLLELRMVAKFVNHGVSLKVIRATIDEAEQTLGTYPLTNRQFLTDGRRIFLRALEEVGVATLSTVLEGARPRRTARKALEPKLLDVLHRQFVFSEIIGPSLYAGIVYDDQDNRRAARWYPMPRRKSVMLDPEVQFGKPILADSGVPTEALHAAWLAEGKDHTAVARAFEVRAAHVKVAVQFEQSLERA